MKQIRILLARMPPLMLEIVSECVASAPDMTLVGVAKGDDLISAAQRMHADVVVLSEKKDASAEYLQLLRQRPCLKVLAIEASGKTGSLYELRPRRVPLGELSARTLASAIRAQAPIWLDS